MRIAKYHGTGNDFVMWDDMEDREPPTAELVAALCDRHMGVGGDGIIRVAPAEDADFFMDYWNSDGTISEMCGNGIRCLGKYVYDRGLTEKTEVAVATRAGVKRLALEVEGGEVSRVRVDMSPPTFDRATLPMKGEGTFLDQPFEVQGRRYRGFAVSMGNAHLVLIGEADPAQIDVPEIGPMLEWHDDFPEGTNVEFVRVEDGVVRARVWERGSGETMACGTGACAALVAANLAGLAARRAPVVFPGGELEVEWAEDDHVFLTGPAAFVFDGEMSTPWMAWAASGAALRARQEARR